MTAPPPRGAKANDPGIEPALERSVGLLSLVLHGIGIAIGAGICVLAGADAGRAAIYAPSAFLFAAVVMALPRIKLRGDPPGGPGRGSAVPAKCRGALDSLWTGLVRYPKTPRPKARAFPVPG